MGQINKREFLKTTSMLGAGAMIPAYANAQIKVDMSPKPQTSLLDSNFSSTSGRHFSSQIIHHGELEGYQVTPISQDKAAPRYQRPGNMHNVTVAALLKKIIEMEGTEAAAGGPCGIGILSQTYLALLKPGDRIVTHRCNYDWMMNWFRDFMPSWGVEVELIDFNDPENLKKSLKAKPAQVVHFEPYVNPTMEVLDTPTLIDIAKKAGAIVIVDNTFLTPYLLQPYRINADLVIHSLTKYIGGHGNAMGGVVTGRKELVDKIDHAQNWLGGLLRPMDAFLITQGLKTLPIRMVQHSKSAQIIAEYLQSHPAVEKVHYGGLPEWNQYLDKNIVKGFGGMMGVQWKDEAVHRNLGDNTKLIVDRTSLGDPVSRIVMRGNEEERGIPARYTRVSIGLEEPEDIIADFNKAISASR